MFEVDDQVNEEENETEEEYKIQNILLFNQET